MQVLKEKPLYFQSSSGEWYTSSLPVLSCVDPPIRKKAYGKFFAHALLEHEFDEGIGLNYAGARFYDPEVGLWISPDPMRQFHSPYTYAGNGYNPINYSDATGLTLGERIKNWFGGEGWRDDTYEENLAQGDFKRMLKNAFPGEDVVYDPNFDYEAGYNINNGQVIFGPKGVKGGEGWLLSTGGHEILIHKQQHAGGKLHKLGTKGHSLNEMEAYFWELENKHIYELTPKQIQLIYSYARNYWNSLPGYLKQRAKTGKFSDPFSPKYPKPK